MPESEKQEPRVSASESEASATPEQPRRPMTDWERQQARKRQEIALKRARQAVREADAERKEEIFEQVHVHREVQKPTTLKGKWENFRYHYGVATIVLLCVIGAVAFLVYDLATQTKYDMNMVLVTKQNYGNTEDNYDAVKQRLTQYMQDSNGDGQINIDLLAMVLDTEDEKADANMIAANQTKLMGSFSGDTDLVYLVDDTFYQQFLDDGIEFVDLSPYSDNPNVDGDRYAIRDDSDFSDLNGKEDLYLVIRALDNLTHKDKEEVQERYARDLEVVKQIIAE